MGWYYPWYYPREQQKLNYQRALDHPQQVGERVLEQEGHELLREHVALMARALLVEEDEVGVFAEELLVRDAQRDALGPVKGRSAAE